MKTQLTAQLAIGGALASLLTLLLLHFLRTDLAAPSSMISEYALGAHGWLMRLCFAAFGVASASLLGALAGQLRSRLGKVGAAFLIAATVGLTLAAVFSTDPPSTAPDQMTFDGQMHAVGFMIGVPGELFAALFLTVELRRRERWRAGLLVASAIATWLSLAIMIPLLISQRGFGIPNRTLMVAYALWLIVAAAPLARRAAGWSVDPRGAEAR
jgi:hypothetical protein